MVGQKNKWWGRFSIHETGSIDGGRRFRTNQRERVMNWREQILQLEKLKF
jgi:hypothetical protein